MLWVYVERIKDKDYHSLLCRTLRLDMEDGFLMTIQSIMDVASEREYLQIVC